MGSWALPSHAAIGPQHRQCHGRGKFTTVTFSFKVAGKIKTTADTENPNVYFIYDVAIAASPDPNPSPSLAPVPIINANNPNGRMAGSPTHFVEFNSLNPNTAHPFTLYEFASMSPPAPPNSPSAPTTKGRSRTQKTNTAAIADATPTLSLSAFAPSTRGQISIFTTPQSGGDPSTLTFSLTTDMLADSDTAARALRTLQVNILTMSRLANSGKGKRIIDALGDSRSAGGLNNFVQIDLLKSGTYSNSLSQIEPAGDTYGGTEPDVDIIDYTITVTPP